MGRKTFEKWITNQKELGVLPAFPTFNIADPSLSEPGVPVTKGSLPITSIFLLLHLQIVPTTVQAMIPAAYQLIYNEYYRDQNQIAEVDYKLIDGDNTANTDLFVLRKRAWEHDYFTACAPSPQAGEAVDLPIGQFQDVNVKFQNNIEPNTVLTGTPLDATVIAGTPDNALTSELYAETSELMPQATTINDLRTAFRLQEWLENQCAADVVCSKIFWSSSVLSLQMHVFNVLNIFQNKNTNPDLGSTSNVRIKHVTSRQHGRTRYYLR